MTDVERAFNALQAGGAATREFPGWRNRAHPGTFDPWGIIFHHDATQFGPSPSVKDWMWVNGDLSPACQFWVDTDGVWWVGANGLAYHAGIGGGWGVIPADSGNRNAFGVETDHTVGEAWPAKQYESIVQGFALIDREFGFDPMNANCGHREYAPDRKIDPDGVDLNRFRQQVADQIRTPSGLKEWPDMAMSEEDKKWITEQLAGIRAGVAADLDRDRNTHDRVKIILNALESGLTGPDLARYVRDRRAAAAAAKGNL